MPAEPESKPARFEVTLDEERQIVRQRVDGHLDMETFGQLETATEACAARLRNPQRVRILVNAPALGRADGQTRRAMAATLKRPTLARLAVYDTSPFGRVMLRFMSIFAGVDKARGFATEAEAIAWLVS